MAEAYNTGMAARSMHRPLVITLSAVGADADRGSAVGQTPQPFPRPGTSKPAPPPPAAPEPTPPDRPAHGAAADHGAGTTADRSDAWRADLSRRGVRRLVRRRTRPALLPVRHQRQLPRHRQLLQERAEAERGADLRGAPDSRVRHRPVPRRDDGVSAERDGEGLHLGRLGGLSQSQARRHAGAFQDDHPDRPGDTF